MDTQQVSAPACATSAVHGVEHVNTRQKNRFTVIGNHLAQHRQLSLLAIGLSTYIQSLPNGARIGIKKLAERFPESEARIAAALRELETHGYLSRTRERLPDGRVVTRTCSYNQPLEPEARRRRPDPRPARRRPAPAPAFGGGFAPPSPPPTPPPPAPVPSPGVSLPRPLIPRDPHPHDEPHPKFTQAAAALLSNLHHHSPHLILTEKEITLLTPITATWFERGATPTTLRHTLTNDLPQPLKHPAKLLRHRLNAYLPTPPTPVTLVDPLQNCDNCDRAFRAPTPGHCAECG
ncbi:helix-turn-helix domain-containing protein [Streptomyces sp. NPDC056347]|uniref:helix-turn-helix domain-containing protein n=1 Tax=Streptomyces sp. NPDC056347 TaxID=3345790 RepID=UPI0035D82010